MSERDFIYTIQRDPDGIHIISRLPLTQGPLGSFAGGFTLGPTVGQFDLIPSLARFANVQRLEAICIEAGVTAGQWILGGGDNDFIIAQPVNDVSVGTRHIWEFPTPFQASNEVTIENTVSGMGSWYFHAHGYLTNVEQGPGTDF